MHCHHEKLVIVDDELAFVGGIDLTALAGDRYDSNEHPHKEDAIGWHDASEPGPWWYGMPKPSTSAAVVGVVGGDERDVGVELAAPVAPQQVDEAVVLARDEHADALRRAARR